MRPTKSAYACGKKHLEDLGRKIDGSVMWRNCRLNHNSELQDFTISVTELYQNDCILRQIVEGVSQGNASGGMLINTKKEWNYLHLPRVIIGDGEGTSMGPRVVSFASVGAETKVLASFASGI